MAQFVPLKVDTSTTEYAALQRKHRSEGNTIPKIFVIRADGQKLYAKSGSLSGDQLPSLLAAAVREMGRPLATAEVKALNEINSSIEKSLESKDLKEASNQFRKLKKLGDMGEINSFAQSALANNELAKKMADVVKGLADEYSANLDSQTKIETAIKVVQLKSAVGTLALFRVPMNELEKKTRSAFENVKDYSEVKAVAAALGKLQHKSPATRARAVETVTSYIQQSQDEQAKAYLTKRLDEAQVVVEKTDVAPNATAKVRTWTSNDGKFTIEASFVEFNGTDVKLRKRNGDVISVPINRLSGSDQKIAREQK